MLTLPTLHILATGGTIAGTADRSDDHTGYTAASLSVQSLLAAAAPIAQLPARLQASQLMQKDSKDMEVADWLAMARAIAERLVEPECCGIVVTHGTDTLEETAWFLHRVLPPSAKPVVLVSAMRPASALGADGPANLLDACLVALARPPAIHGVVAVAAGEVHSAQLVQKLQPYRIPAFSSGGAGPLAWIEDGRVRLAHATLWPNTKNHGVLPEPVGDGVDGWMAPGKHQALLQKPAAQLPAPPAVAWINSHAGFDPRQIEALVRAEFDGVLVAGTGNASLHHALEQALQEAQRAGLAIVLTSRCPLGPPVGPARTWQRLALPPAKARVELLLKLWVQKCSPSQAASQ